VIIFPNFDTAGDGTTYYADDFEQVGGVAATLPTLPVTFEDANITYNNLPFGDLVSSVIANPDASGDNTSATVLSLEKVAGAMTWAGATIPLESVIDWTGGSVLSVKVWSPNAGTPFLLKIEDLTDPMNILSAEVLATATGANAWETLTFDMATSSVGTFDAALNYSQVIIFPNFDVAGDGTTYYADDFMKDGDVAISELDKANVVVTTFPNPADQVVNVKYSIPVSGNITFTMVDILGRNVQEVNEGNIYEGNYQTVIDVNGLNSGVYYLITRLDGEIISTKNIMKK